MKRSRSRIFTLVVGLAIVSAVAVGCASSAFNTEGFLSGTWVCRGEGGASTQQSGAVTATFGPGTWTAHLKARSHSKDLRGSWALKGSQLTFLTNAPQGGGTDDGSFGITTNSSAVLTGLATTLKSGETLPLGLNYFYGPSSSPVPHDLLIKASSGKLTVSVFRPQTSQPDNVIGCTRQS